VTLLADLEVKVEGSASIASQGLCYVCLFCQKETGRLPTLFFSPIEVVEGSEVIALLFV
jgi:hypothetical protein